jgi:hypothetical protein
MFSTAARAAADDTMVGKPCVACGAAMTFTMTPLLSRMCCTKASRQHRNAPFRLVSTTAFHPLSETLCVGDINCPPELLTLGAAAAAGGGRRRRRWDAVHSRWSMGTGKRQR